MGGARTSDHTVADRDGIRRVVDEIDNAVDAKDWELRRSYFTDEIYADFTSFAGGEPGRIPAYALVGGGGRTFTPIKRATKCARTTGSRRTPTGPRCSRKATPYTS